MQLSLVLFAILALPLVSPSAFEGWHTLLNSTSFSRELASMPAYAKNDATGGRKPIVLVAEDFQVPPKMTTNRLVVDLFTWWYPHNASVEPQRYHFFLWAGETHPLGLWSSALSSLIYTWTFPTPIAVTSVRGDATRRLRGSRFELILPARTLSSGVYWLGFYADVAGFAGDACYWAGSDARLDYLKEFAFIDINGNFNATVGSSFMAFTGATSGANHYTHDGSRFANLAWALYGLMVVSDPSLVQPDTFMTGLPSVWPNHPSYLQVASPSTPPPLPSADSALDESSVRGAETSLVDTLASIWTVPGATPTEQSTAVTISNQDLFHILVIIVPLGVGLCFTGLVLVVVLIYRRYRKRSEIRVHPSRLEDFRPDDNNAIELDEQEEKEEEEEEGGSDEDIDEKTGSLPQSGASSPHFEEITFSVVKQAPPPSPHSELQRKQMVKLYTDERNIIAEEEGEDEDDTPYLDAPPTTVRESEDEKDGVASPKPFEEISLDTARESARKRNTRVKNAKSVTDIETTDLILRSGTPTRRENTKEKK